MTERRDEAGFTLVEVLVALALIAALLAVLFTGIGVGFKGMSRLDDQVERVEARRNLELLLRRQVAAAFAGSAGAPSFVGQPASLTFLTLAGNAGPSYDRVSLTLEDGASGRELVVTRRAQSPGVLLGFDRLVVARGVTRFRLRYFGAPTSAEPRVWRDRWEGLRSLPELVEVSLRLASDGDYDWPDAVVRVWSSESGL